MAKSQSVFPKAINVVGDRQNAEQSLWRNVLITCALDKLTKVLAPGIILSRAQVIRMLVDEKAKKLNGKITKRVSKGD